MKHFRLIPFLAVALATGLTFTACDSDDDEGGSGSGKNTAGALDDRHGNSELPDGYRISSVGDYRYYYENGQLSQIYLSGSYIDFSTKGITIEDEYDDEVMKISFNGNGLVSKITFTSGGGSDNWSSSESISFSYNSNNQISSYSGSWKESGTDEGESYSESGSGSGTFTYSGQIIKKVVQKSSYSGKEDGEKYSGSETYTYTFDFDAEYDNIYGQWTPYMTYVLAEDGIFRALAYAGCLGRATSMLPTTIYEKNIEVEDGETYEDDDTYNCSYSFNAYGAIRQADGKSYTYTTISNDDYDVKATRAAEQSVLKPFAQQTRKGHTGIFRRHRNK